MRYLGRIDNQAKIRVIGQSYKKGCSPKGLRDRSSRFCGLARARWLCRPGRCLREQKVLDEGKALNYYRTYLPSCIVPQRIHALDALPLNLNGEVHRKGTPPPARLAT
jgi:hypothetical protein